MSSDPDKIEAARAKDRERKKMKRAQQREEIVKGNRVLKEHIKARKREHMKTYRKNLKSTKDTTASNESEKKAESFKKQQTVLNTQRWRMKIKLA